ncbi:hypothetical protein K2173_025166 [Erythroxylum novogranatense]|uniref:Copia protein n=1 Tax=Erythroxylum novogranatense TaxID=1862640 RepID=A0AAV8SWR2_9ROSI|nr:hypothetical protein K2173_025166 [Erythroxylum novogranatense]
MSVTHQLDHLEGEPLPDPYIYRRCIGALQYACLTRPDLSYAVNKLSQYMSTPTDIHWQACKRVLRYVKETLTQGLLLVPSSTTSLQVFTDADWAGDKADRRSTSGFAAYLGKNLISWSSKKQRTVARSSTEAKYRSVANATTEIMWLQSLLSEIAHNVSSPIVVWCDNLGAAFLSLNPVFKPRTKHIECDYHFVREQCSQGKITVQYISTNDQIADVFTKPLSTTRFSALKRKLRVI